MPYVFQIFAALLEGNSSAPIPEYFKTLIPRILKVDFWSSKGNVPALVRLLSSTMERAASEFVDSNQIEPVLGIFKQLFSTKANELQAFELLESILSNIPPCVTLTFQSEVVTLLMSQQESNNKLLCSYHADGSC